jgi:molecular chaperone DnaJ
VADGQRIKVKGRGGSGRYGGPAGDLFVVVHIAPHPVFTQKGKDLSVRVPVTFAEAALGTTVAVPTLNGKPVTLKVPAGTPSGRIFRVAGQGVPIAGKPGDLLVTFEVDVPAKLSADEKRAVEALARASAAEGQKLREKLGALTQ